MAASESRAEHAFLGGDRGRDHYRAHGESVGDALGEGYYVGPDARPLVGEETSAASVTRLHLVENHDRARRVALLAHGAQELVRRHTDAVHALDALDDDGGVFARAELGAHGVDVVEVGESHLVGAVHGRLNRGVVGRGHGHARAAVERSAHGQHAAAPRGERRQFQGVLVCLGAAVAQKQFVIGITRQLAEFLGQFALQVVYDGVRIESDASQLLGDLLDIVRMGVTYRDNRVPSVKVEVLHAVAIPQIGSASLHWLHVEQGIYLKQIHSFHNLMYGRRRSATPIPRGIKNIPPSVADPPFRPIRT